MQNKNPSAVVKQGFFQKRKNQVKTYVTQSLQQPISIKESKNWIATTSDSIKSLGIGRQLTWPEYAGKMKFSSAENVLKAYRNVSILFYLCLVAFLFALLELLYLIGSSIGGETLSMTSMVGTLLSLAIGANLMIISSKELWMINHKKVVNIHQWFTKLLSKPFEVFPVSLDYEKAVNLFHYCNQPKASN